MVWIAGGTFTMGSSLAGSPETSSLPTKFGSMASGLINMTSRMRSSENLLRRLAIGRRLIANRLGRTQKRFLPELPSPPKRCFNRDRSSSRPQAVP